MRCRHCDSALEQTFLDLGFAPPSNAYLNREDLQKPEVYFPLKLKVCVSCWLVQTEDYAKADELFKADYAYFSSTSTTWLKHAEIYAAEMIARFELDNKNFVVEIASNDGYLLKNFVQAQIPCLGIEPTANTAEAARKLGIPVLSEFFGVQVATQLKDTGKQADLVAGNNVYAHVPDINDFTKGLAILLKPEGVITLEFPHLLNLIEQNQFDTVYHEHYSYLSLQTVQRIFRSVGLRIFDVQQLSAHGGSLRIFGCHENSRKKQMDSVDKILRFEHDAGLNKIDTYLSFQEKADAVKNDLLTFLLEQKLASKTVAAYGAAAKGCTLLNYAGVKPDLLPIVADAAVSKQGKFLPGSHIPIVALEEFANLKLDFVIVLPWNILDEVTQSQAYLAQRGTKFITFIPQRKICNIV